MESNEPDAGPQTPTREAGEAARAKSRANAGEAPGSTAAQAIGQIPKARQERSGHE